MCGVAASDQWLPRLPNDVSEPAFDGTNFRPIDFFLRTFPLVLLNLLCTETNRYFSQWSQQQGVIVNESIRKAWFDAEVPEMRVFIALLIFMGLDRRYSYRSYWSTHWMLGMPGFRSVMPRDRFFAILRFLRISDNSTAVPRGQPGHDRSFKIRPMITSLAAAWQAAYKIGKSVSVDECMVPFKGRVSMIQYMPKKPNKWGLKGWVLAASEQWLRLQKDHSPPYREAAEPAGFESHAHRMMAILKNAIFLFAFCSLCSGIPADEGRQEVSRFMLVYS